MLKFASQLPDDYEYGIVWWGQSNATPNGSNSDGSAEDPHLTPLSVGKDVVIVGQVTGTGTETVTITTDAAAAISGDFAGGELRVGRPGTPRIGYATIGSNTTTQITLTWQENGPSLSGTTQLTGGGQGISNSGADPAVATVTHNSHGMVDNTKVLIAGADVSANNGTFLITIVDANTYTYTLASAQGSSPTSNENLLATGVADCYTLFRDGRNSVYDNVRVLQSYLPNAVAANPTAASPLAPPGPGYTALPTTVNSYSKLGLFLDFTFYEGIAGFGFYDTAVSPATTSITISGGWSAPRVMVGGLVRAESYDVSSLLTTVSTGTIASSRDTTNFTTDQTDITTSTDLWTETAHGMLDGQEVIPVLATGTLPTTSAQIVSGTSYYVTNKAANTFQLATSRLLAIAGTNITISATGTGTIDWHTAAFTSDETMVDTASDEIDLGAVTHGLVTGQRIHPVLLSGSWPTTTTTQIDWNTPLYAIVVDVNEFQLATSAANAAAGTALTLTTANTQDIEWHTDTILTLDSSGWSGGTPSGTTYKAETWLGHWFDNPHALAAGPGFLHPTNNSQPTAAVYSRPRSNTTYGWGTLWGAMLSYASRVSDATGKRIHIIPLAYDATGIITAGTVVTADTHGWRLNGAKLDWNPLNDAGLAARLKTLITVTAPGALTAEGNSKSLRIIGIGPGFQGETEAITETGRAQYKNLLPTFYQWLRDTIFDAGLSYYSTSDKMPILHPGIHKVVWEQTVSGKDEDGVVNSAITNFTSKVPFATTIDVDSSPISTVTGHYDGEGEAINGKLSAVAMIQAIDDALSSEDVKDNPEVLDICNMALAYIGDVAKITSLDTSVDTSAQASYCSKFYDRAREMLLQQMAWSFATRRTPLEEIDDARTDEWAFAYGVPNNAVRVFAVLPPGAGDDVYSAAQGSATVQDSTGAIRTRTLGQYVPLPFTVEQDDDGHKIIYTNTDDAIGRYNVRISDARQYSPIFVNALALKLASMLAGPIIKGIEGAKLTGSLLQMLALELSKAEQQDAIQHNIIIDHMPPTIRARW